MASGREPKSVPTLEELEGRESECTIGIVGGTIWETVGTTSSTMSESEKGNKEKSLDGGDLIISLREK